MFQYEVFPSTRKSVILGHQDLSGSVCFLYCLSIEMRILSVEYDIVRCFCAPGDSKLMFCFSKHVQLFICDRSYRSWWPRINLFPLLLSTSEFFSCLYKTWLIQKSSIFYEWFCTHFNKQALCWYCVHLCSKRGENVHVYTSALMSDTEILSICHLYVRWRTYGCYNLLQLASE